MSSLVILVGITIFGILALIYVFTNQEQNHENKVNINPDPTYKKPPLTQQRLNESVNTISEPVQSILRSMDEGWWSVDIRKRQTCTLTHEWFGNTLQGMLLGFCIDEYDTLNFSLYDCKWMTDKEEKAVEEMCLKLIRNIEYYKRKQKETAQRELYMNLVGFDV